MFIYRLGVIALFVLMVALHCGAANARVGMNSETAGFSFAAVPDGLELPDRRHLVHKLWLGFDRIPEFTPRVNQAVLPDIICIGGLAGCNFGTPPVDQLILGSWEGPFDADLKDVKFESYASGAWTQWGDYAAKTDLMISYHEDRLTIVACHFQTPESGVEGLWGLAQNMRTEFVTTYGAEMVLHDKLTPEGGYLYLQDRLGSDLSIKWDPNQELLLAIARESWWAKQDPLPDQLAASD